MILIYYFSDLQLNQTICESQIFISVIFSINFYGLNNRCLRASLSVLAERKGHVLHKAKNLYQPNP